MSLRKRKIEEHTVGENQRRRQSETQTKAKKNGIEKARQAKRQIEKQTLYDSESLRCHKVEEKIIKFSL